MIKKLVLLAVVAAVASLGVSCQQTQSAPPSTPYPIVPAK
jgi:hypothetical protein